MPFDSEMSPAVTTPGPLAEIEAASALDFHLQPYALEVQDDVGHVLAHACHARELVQDIVDLHRGDGRALKRRHQYPTQRVAGRSAETPLQRLGDERRLPLRIIARLDLKLLRLDQIGPILVDHAFCLHTCPRLMTDAGNARGKCEGHPGSVPRGRVRMAVIFVQTRRRFGGRQPLCAIGVTSRIDVMLNPTEASARNADSRPEPVPGLRLPAS